MNKVKLNAFELRNALDTINKLEVEDSQSVTLTSDSSSGIGTVINLEVNVVINGVSGIFLKTLVDHTNW